MVPKMKRAASESRPYKSAEADREIGVPVWSNVGGYAGDFFADDELVDVVGAFVGEDGFEIVHVAHDAVIVDDAVGAENVARLAGDVERDANVIHFEHGDVGGIDFAGVF